MDIDRALRDRVMSERAPFSDAIGDRGTRILRVTAGALAVFVAWLHLLHPEYGWETLFLYLELGTIYDPRPPLFVASGGAILVAVGLVIYGAPRRPIYAAGVLLVLTYLLGYAAWHTVLDHGAFWPHIEPHHHHDMGLLETLVEHLRADTIALASTIAEVLLLVLLATLLLVDGEGSES